MNKLRLLLFYTAASGLVHSQGAFSGVPTIKNFAPDFLTYWDSVKDKSSQEKLAAFKRQVIPPYKCFYKFKFEKWKKKGQNPDEEIMKEILAFPKIEDRFRKTTAAITGDIDRNLRTFMSRFPDMRGDFKIYILHSLGEMDGGSRNFDDEFKLIFGVDGMAKYHNGKTEVPFFHHELFHVYHEQKGFNTPNIYTSLWS